MRKILKYLKPYKGTAIASVIFTLFGNVMTLILPFLMSKIVNEGIVVGDVDRIIEIGLVMLVVSLLGVFISVGGSYFTSKASVGFGTELRRAVFEKTENLSVCDVEKIGTPSLITRCTNDINRIQEMILSGMRIIIAAPIMLLGSVVMALVLNPRLSLSILIAIPTVAVLAVFVAKKVMPLFSVEQKRTDALNKILREKLSGIRVIRAFNKTKHEDERFRSANLELTGIALTINRMFSALIPIVILLVFAFFIFIIWMAGSQLNALNPVTQAAEISGLVGDLQAFVIYMIMIIFSSSMAAAMLIMLPRAEISAKRIGEVLDTQSAVAEPAAPKSFPAQGNGTLEYRNVSFGYPGAEEKVLSNISFTSHSGEVTAIIGGTGCGKSTLVNLLPRFYDVSDGAILIDGTDIREVSLEELHGKVGFIPQKATLFSGTIADNIRYGKPDATEDEIWAALATAGADDFVRETENGLDTLVTQNGTNFSGGQKQRLAIARAVIGKAAILVFDDSFSALDFATDAKVRCNIRRDLADSDILIVAQRVGTIMDADRIIVLDEGRAVGIGTHRELLQSCDVYREIVESQFTEEDMLK